MIATHSHSPNRASRRHVWPSGQTPWQAGADAPHVGLHSQLDGNPPVETQVCPSGHVPSHRRPSPPQVNPVVVDVVGGDSQVQAAVHAMPLAQPPPPGSQCSPLGPSTKPSPQRERRAVNGVAVPPLLLKRPVITPQSGAAILAFRRDAPVLPQDGHFALSLVKWLFAAMWPATARHPLS